MNSYICFYKNFRYEVAASAPEAALDAATRHFKVKPDKVHKIDVRLKQKAA